MSLPTSNNNPESSLTTLVSDGSLDRTKVGCPAGLSPLFHNNGGSSCSTRRVSGNGNNEPLCEEHIMKEIEEVGSANERRRSASVARVDPILDFWTVDDEGLVGRFQVWSGSPSSGVNHRLSHQQAVIFKVKTTSHRFCVRPVCGLMRPNVMATVEVRCERRVCQMENDEFLVEVAPVPGAVAAMTNDLYTSSVHSNYPELMAVWERIDQDVREFHRISCRFHRTTQQLELSLPSQIRDQVEGRQVGRLNERDNNNFGISNNNDECDLCYENCNATTERKWCLAREAADPQGQGCRMSQQSYRNSKVRRLEILSSILGFLLILALLYICFGLFHVIK